VRRQQGDFDLVEVLAVDSGSTDGTLEILARHDVRVLRIAPQEFGHGRTRNLAARAATGDVVVYLTQDASPANDRWLAALVRGLEEDPLLAGVWSRHEPRPGCHPMEWRTLAEFPLFQDGRPRVSSARGNPDYAAHPEQYYWFSNNSSAIRRAVLLRWPFPEVEFAEDQAWARLVLEAGFRTALVPESLILHSHAYSAWTNLQRNFDHARAMAEDLGQRHAFGIGDVLRAAVRETRRDVAFWARLRGRTRARVAARWAAPALAYHLGAFGGRWLGLRAGRWPSALAGRLSLHERVRAG
jgi:rhamnosyltransferase